jgi:hypothetical protein
MSEVAENLAANFNRFARRRLELSPKSSSRSMKKRYPKTLSAFATLTFSHGVPVAYVIGTPL